MKQTSAGQSTPRPPSGPYQYVGVAVTCVISMVVAWAAYNYVPPLMAWLARAVAARWLHLICVLGVVIVGGALYLLRAWRKHYFGILEFAFALLTAWHAMDDLPSLSDVDYLRLVGAAYFMVRGITNYREGLAEKRKEAPDAAASGG